jgi:PAS domain S-box-containing protein
LAGVTDEASKQRASVILWCAVLVAALGVGVRAVLPVVVPEAHLGLSTDIHAVLRGLVALVAVAWAARRGGPGWGLLTLALASWLLGCLGTLGKGLAAPGDKAAWQWAALLPYLLFYPLFLIGVLRIPRQRHRADLGRHLDLTICLLGGTLLLGVVLLQPGLATLNALDPATLIEAIGYPLGGVFLLWASLSLAVHPARRQAASGRVLLAGCLLVLITDTIYGLQLIHGSYLSGNHLGILWSSGVLLLGLAGVLEAVGSEDTPRQASTGTALGRQGLAAIILANASVAAAWCAAILADSDTTRRLLLLGLGVLLALAGGRLLLLWRAHRRLDQDLDRRVALRTAELSNAHQRLQASEERYREVFDTTGDALLVIDGHERVLTVNRTARELLPAVCEPEASLAQCWSDESGWSHADLRPRLAQAQAGMAQMLSWRCRDGAGRRFWADVVLSPALIGGEARLIVSIRDVDARHAAEEQLAHLQRLESIGQLAGGVAHDFNNVLAGIRGAAELAGLTLPDGHPARHHLSLIEMAADRAGGLTSKLLTFARRQHARRESVSMHEILSACRDLLAPTFGPGLVLEFTMQATQDHVVGDAAELQNAVINLCLNARDALTEGNGRIQVGTTVEPVTEAGVVPGFTLTRGPHLAICVTDNGCGMSAEVRERIFEPFFTTKPTGKGTGLGLSAVYGTVTAMGGAIRVSSTPGAGSIFTLLLPLEARPVATRRQRSSSRPRVRPGRLLLVDDEAMLRDTGRELLSDRGFTVCCAGSCDEALAMLSGPDAEGLQGIILDLVMPGRSGTEAFRALRAQRPDLPIVLCSGYAPDAVIGALLREPQTAFVGKPYRVDTLIEALGLATQR